MIMSIFNSQRIINATLMCAAILLFASAQCYTDKLSRVEVANEAYISLNKKNIALVKQHSVAIDIIVAGYINPPKTDGSEIHYDGALKSRLLDCPHQIKSECAMSFSTDMVPTIWFD